MVQGITLLWTMLKSGHEILGGKPMAKRIVICCPTSLVNNWDSECIKWLKVGPATLLQTYLQQYEQIPMSISLLLGFLCSNSVSSLFNSPTQKTAVCNAVLPFAALHPVIIFSPYCGLQCQHNPSQYCAAIWDCFPFEFLPSLFGTNPSFYLLLIGIGENLAPLWVIARRCRDEYSAIHQPKKSLSGLLSIVYLLVPCTAQYWPLPWLLHFWFRDFESSLTESMMCQSLLRNLVCNTKDSIDDLVGIESSYCHGMGQVL